MPHPEYFTIRGKAYRCDITKHFLDDEMCWTAFRYRNGGFERIPCFTRAEEKRFPVSVAKQCSQILKTYEDTWGKGKVGMAKLTGNRWRGTQQSAGEGLEI